MVDFMKLLVTGGSGFIGTHLIDLLLDKGYDMINVSDVAPKKASHLQFWRPCNLEDIERLRNLACKFKPRCFNPFGCKVGRFWKQYRDLYGKCYYN
jgi:nucleoside-diphosphate-sugar epimerase